VFSAESMSHCLGSRAGEYHPSAIKFTLSHEIYVCEASLNTLYPPPPAHHNARGVEEFEMIWFQTSKRTGA